MTVTTPTAPAPAAPADERLGRVGLVTRLLKRPDIGAFIGAVAVWSLFAITANVKFGPVPSGFGLQVELVAEIPQLPRDQAEALLRRAHEVCPYSNATRGNIVVDVHLA